MALKGRIDNSKALAADTHHVVSAASNNAANIKSSAAQVTGYYVGSLATAAMYVKLYNKASSPSPGSDTPRLTILIPPGSAANQCFDPPLAFETGLGVAIVAGIADNDNTSVAANEVVANIFFQ